MLPIFRFFTWPFLCSALASRGELGRSIEPGQLVRFHLQFTVISLFIIRSLPELRRRPEGGEGGWFGFVRDPPSTAL